MTTRRERIPAIVWGCGPTAVGVLRCLHLANIPTFVASPPRDAIAHSRFYRPLPGPDPWQGALDADVGAALHALPFDEAVVVPCADDTALRLSEVPGSDLADRVRVSTSARATLETLQDKTKFAAYLGGTGIPHPRTFLIGSAADIASVPYEELDSTFLKPADSQSFSEITGVKA